MYAIAIIGDLCSLIPFVNLITTPITALALGMAGAGTKHSIYSDGRIGATLLVMVLEILPVVSFIPAWTIRVYLAKKNQ
jgi:hypothetical protein